MFNNKAKKDSASRNGDLVYSDSKCNSRLHQVCTIRSPSVYLSPLISLAFLVSSEACRPEKEKWLEDSYYDEVTTARLTNVSEVLHKTIVLDR